MVVQNIIQLCDYILFWSSCSNCYDSSRITPFPVVGRIFFVSHCLFHRCKVIQIQIEINPQSKSVLLVEGQGLGVQFSIDYQII
jgi:hypothetical protein